PQVPHYGPKRRIPCRHPLPTQPGRSEPYVGGIRMHCARPSSCPETARKMRLRLGVWLALPALALLLGMSAAAPVAATPQQAPNSRVVIDLPPDYAPSPLFSGFQNEALGVSFIILEAPAAEYDKMAQGFTPQELGKARH